MKRSHFPDDWLAQIKEHYPRRKGGYGWYDLERHINARSAKFTWDEMIAGAKRYRKFAISESIYGTPYVMQPARFFGRCCYFTEPWETDPELVHELRRPDEYTESQRQADAEKAVAQMDFYRAAK